MSHWIDTIEQRPKHGELVVCHMGYSTEPDPNDTKVAVYDAKEDLFAFGRLRQDENSFSYYAFCGFARSEIVTAWMPFPETTRDDLIKVIRGD